MIKKKDCCTGMVGQFFFFLCAKVCLCGDRNRELPFIFCIPDITLSI